MNINGELRILLIVLGFTYGLFALTSLSLMLYPPKEINNLVGYHSENASRSQANWDYANKLAARLMFLISNISIIVALASVYFLQNHLPINGLWTICMCLLCFPYVLLLPVVEIKLNKFEEKQKALGN